MKSTTEKKLTTYPVIETFGPTIQGEGPDAGRPCYFVRFGGCDYRCSWCDTMYAVEPAQVRANSTRMSTDEIASKLVPETLVVLSGGNPALLNLEELIDTLMWELRCSVAVETQGSVWKPWLAEVDTLVVSPKPPSSGMDTPAHREQFKEFMTHADESAGVLALKVVVFGEADLEWALGVHREFPYWPFYLSAGTPQGDPDAHTKAAVLETFRWLCEQVAARPELRDARVLPQLHVLAFGTQRGV